MFIAYQGSTLPVSRLSTVTKGSVQTVVCAQVNVARVLWNGVPVTPSLDAALACTTDTYNANNRSFNLATSQVRGYTHSLFLSLALTLVFSVVTRSRLCCTRRRCRTRLLRRATRSPLRCTF